MNTKFQVGDKVLITDSNGWLTPCIGIVRGLAGGDPENLFYRVEFREAREVWTNYAAWWYFRASELKAA